MEQQLIQHLKSEILKTSLNPKKVIKLPAKMEGIESQDLEELLTELYRGVVEDRGNEFRERPQADHQFAPAGNPRIREDLAHECAVFVVSLLL